MKLRGVRRTNCVKNFLGYQLEDNNRLVKHKTYGASSDWPDLLFQVNKLKGCGNGWKHSDNLVKFVLKARMNQIPCNQQIHCWNKDHDKNALCAITIQNQWLI